MRRNKKVTAIFIAAAIIFLMSGVSASAQRKSALSTSAGVVALRNEFDSGAAPKAGGYALDYCYYSPVGSNDKTKYPLVIYLHGIGHGSSVGSQLADSDMAYWASSELQARFSQGGAFILLPRAPENKMVYWGTSLLESLRMVIDNFIDLHGANIDTTRIFIGGSSAGAEMTWDMIVAFPEYFAGAFPIAATGIVTDRDTKACSDVAIWMFASTLDPVINYVTTTLPLWNNVCSNNNHPENCRLSSFTSVVAPGGDATSDNHHMAKVVTYDMHMLDGSTYPNVSTENGLGNTVALHSPNGMIYWMNSVSSDYTGSQGIGSGNINMTLISDAINSGRNIFLKLVNIIQNLFDL